MTQDARRLNEWLGADVQQAMRAARISRELAAEPTPPAAHQHCAETLARVAEQRHAACHEATVAQERTAALEIQVYRRGTAIICMGLVIAAETALLLMGWL